MKKELMRQGKGLVEHRRSITAKDMAKLYEHDRVFNIDVPTGLQQKVAFELIFYTCRRGCENLHSMTKNTYGIFVDDHGREYVEQVQSEIDKNHDENRSADATTGEGRMYDRPGSKHPSLPTAQLHKNVWRTSRAGGSQRLNGNNHGNNHGNNRGNNCESKAVRKQSWERRRRTNGGV